MNQNHPRKDSISTRRTYLLLKAALFRELEAAPFERITLTDICSRSMIPRSTFYRYFEDKYDLLQYCLLSLVNELGLTKEVLSLKDAESMKQFLHLLLIFTKKLEDAEKDGIKAKIAYPILSCLLTDFFFSVIKCYLELSGQFDTDVFIENICRFAERDFFTE